MGSPLNRTVVVAASVADLVLITGIVAFWPGAVGLNNEFFVLYYPVVFAFALVFPRAIEAAIRFSRSSRMRQHASCSAALRCLPMAP